MLWSYVKMQNVSRRTIRLGATSSSLEECHNTSSSVVSTKHHHLKRNNKTTNYKLQRLPFFLWISLISLYCCIVLLHRSFLHVKSPYKVGRSTWGEFQQLSSSDSTDDGSTVNNRKLVHVIQTRFMQHQGSLLELGKARLALFEAFCFPSVLAQTNQNFIWIIRVDPSINEEIIVRMRQLVGESRRDNILILGSLRNPEGMGRDDHDFDHFLGLESTGKVFCGNITLARDAFEMSAARSSSVLLETRLDADDAIHRMFVDDIQNQAQQYLVDNKSGEKLEQNWRIWCARTSLEWHPLNPYPVLPNDDKKQDEGYLVMYSDQNICTTPGLTYGYGFDTTRSSILGGRRLKHSDIEVTIEQCGNGVEVNCVSHLELSFRARTVTSAGMANIVTGNDFVDKNSNGLMQKKDNKQLIRQLDQQEKLWQGAASLFSITKASARDARSLVISRMNLIAADNLRGQCTAGHSCKENGKMLLNAMIQQRHDVVLN